MSNIIKFPTKADQEPIPAGMVSLNWRVEQQIDGTYTAMVVIEGIKQVDVAIATADRMCSTVEADMSLEKENT